MVTQVIGPPTEKRLNIEKYTVVAVKI